VSLDGDEFAAWFRLLSTAGVGREHARRLLTAFGSPDAVLSAPASALREAVGPALAKALAERPDAFDQRLAQARDWLTSATDRHVIALGDPRYPQRLLESPDAPLLLYLQGDLTKLGQPSLAMVGSRRATAQGLDTARSFAAALAQGGLTIISGLAQGIDKAAHEGALDTDAGTIAVVGNGLDRVYPAAHRDLAHRIAQRGLLVSEYAPGTPPLPEHFPQRNRIISGLSLGTLVVEAALRSGSLITARLASEAGREVFAIPGSIHAAQSQGCHALIKQGAKLVETPQDVLDELPSAAPPGARTTAALPSPVDDSDGDPLLAALGHAPTTLDAIQARTGLPTGELMARLLELELLGRVARLPGNLYQRRSLA